MDLPACDWEKCVGLTRASMRSAMSEQQKLSTGTESGSESHLSLP